jgi:DNA-directed RNA polymerase specialized sigma subunit
MAIHAYFIDHQNSHQAAELLGLSRSGFYALLKRAVARLATNVQPCNTNDGANH